jgi:hypothetical protein
VRWPIGDLRPSEHRRQRLSPATGLPQTIGLSWEDRQPPALRYRNKDVSGAQAPEVNTDNRRSTSPADTPGDGSRDDTPSSRRAPVRARTHRRGEMSEITASPPRRAARGCGRLTSTATGRHAPRDRDEPSGNRRVTAPIGPTRKITVKHGCGHSPAIRTCRPRSGRHHASVGIDKWFQTSLQRTTRAFARPVRQARVSPRIVRK